MDQKPTYLSWVRHWSSTDTKFSTSVWSTKAAAWVTGSIMQEVDHSGFNCIASNKVIESMICDGCVQGVIKKYDFSKMPAKQKLFCQAIYKKSKLLTYMMALLQNWKRKRALFR